MRWSSSGMELGYHVTLIKDATAAFEQEGMHAAHEVNGPRFAHLLDHRAQVRGPGRPPPDPIASRSAARDLRDDENLAVGRDRLEQGVLVDLAVDGHGHALLEMAGQRGV